ncbi:hypothetical protein D0Z07_3438 [Hyphodiscus hymeniophilus]|uniref:Postreplication repair E3 ubiquitin-protein ligase RAD18 n=1 Tax=Hyphodiscus hymeniophilus TaxID=353542 RepID=A0A9P7AYX9_9HELO|nr:hypothetical protein D0Z07_3438 [Hyphodiscus hymeniophilus]
MAPKRKVNDVARPRGADERNWEARNIAQLKAELTTRGLFLTGKKAALVARLQTDDNDASVAPVQPANEGEEAEETATWNAKTVPQLKSELTTRGLSLAGKKAALVARLEAHDNGQAVDVAPTAKRAKKKGPPEDIEINGPLAADVIVHKQVNRETGERRQREFIATPDDKFKATFWRVTNERMFLMDRRMSQDQKGYACQVFDIAGSTGNIYNVTIGRRIVFDFCSSNNSLKLVLRPHESPNCDCMDARMRGQKCKHINYALIVILKAPAYLQYQLAFLSDELESIFANAPVTRAPDEQNHDEDNASLTDSKRKPIDGDCSICVFPMVPGEEELVWCKAACGQNFHSDCFEMWKRSKNGGRVTCVYCRTEWQEPGQTKGPLASLASTAPFIGSYRNIGHHEMYRAGLEQV